jgi:hypothetical protein
VNPAEYLSALYKTVNISNVNRTVDQVELFDKVKEFNVILDSYHNHGITYYVQLGYVLALLKERYYNKCVKCRSETNLDIFDVIYCKQCIYNSRLKTKRFYSDILQYYNYCESHINFVINIGHLGYKYPKFKLCIVTFSEVKSFMRRLNEQLAIDKDIWI